MTVVEVSALITVVKHVCVCLWFVCVVVDCNGSLKHEGKHLHVLS